MKLIDILQTNKGVFETYADKYPNDFLSIYDVVDDDFTKYLDVLFTSLYGEKTLNNIVNQYELHNFENPIDFICYLIHFNCVEKCLDIKNIFHTDYDFTSSRKETIKEKNTTIGNTVNNGTMENVENTYGYDTETPVKDNSTNNTDTNETTHNTETTKEYERITSDIPIQKAMDIEIDRKIKDDYILLTFKTYSNILFLDIYE